MCDRLHSTIVLAVVVFSLFTAHAQGDEGPALTNGSILQMVAWHINDSEIIAAIGRNQTQFELSPPIIRQLRARGVHDAVLDAMWKSTVSAARGGYAQPAEQEYQQIYAPPVQSLTAPSAAGLGEAHPPLSVPTAGPPCAIKLVGTKPSGDNQTYSYVLQCSRSVVPNAIAISTSSQAPAFTTPQTINSSGGVGFQSYDANASTVFLSFPAGNNPAGFQIVVPSSSTSESAANFYIASGSLRDASKCQGAAPFPPEVCSTGTIDVPVIAELAKSKSVCPNRRNLL